MMATGSNACSSVEELELWDRSDDEDIVSKKPSSSEDVLFDETIGNIQDIIIDDEFTDLQQSFMEKHYHHFEDKEENKFVYTDIHKEYVEKIESHINKHLLKRMPNFDMKQFMASLVSRRDQVPEEVFDMLVSFTDFLTFKQMFLDFKAEKEGLGLNLDGLLITSSAHSNR